MTNKEFNNSKEEKRQMFFDMQEHPDRYTDEQVERLLADEDVRRKGFLSRYGDG